LSRFRLESYALHIPLSTISISLAVFDHSFSSGSPLPPKPPLHLLHLSSQPALRQRHLAEHDLFPSLIRTNIVARAIASTHTRIPLALCSKWTNLSASELASFVEEQGWKIEGESVTIPVNEDNGVKGKTVRENVELSQLQKIIAAGGN
jgi:hypothetical protein